MIHVNHSDHAYLNRAGLEEAYYSLPMQEQDDLREIGDIFFYPNDMGYKVLKYEAIDQLTRIIEPLLHPGYKESSAYAREAATIIHTCSVLPALNPDESDEKAMAAHYGANLLAIGLLAQSQRKRYVVQQLIHYDVATAEIVQRYNSRGYAYLRMQQADNLLFNLLIEMIQELMLNGYCPDWDSEFDPGFHITPDDGAEYGPNDAEEEPEKPEKPEKPEEGYNEPEPEPDDTPTPDGAKSPVETAVEQIVAKVLRGDGDTLRFLQSIARTEADRAMRQYRSQKQRKEVTISVKVKEAREAVESSNPDFQYMVTHLATGTNVMLVGPTGSGKTVLARKLGKAVGLEPEQIHLVSCEPFTMKGHFIGQVTDSSGSYSPGVFEAASGEGMVILDEITKLDNRLAGALNAPLSRDEHYQRYFTTGRGEHLPMPKYIVATANVFGHGFDSKYVGNQQQDLSLLDRFPAKYYVDYDEQLERSLVDDSVFERFKTLRDKLMEHRLRYSITLRDMIAADRALQADPPIPLEKSVEILTADWSEDAKRKVGLL